jgi:hypothetical protein
MASDRFGGGKGYAQREQGYRDRALKMYPWICGRCAREFTHSNLRELTVHHIDHNHENNPPDGSNWELLCLYCHDNEHSKYSEQTLYGFEPKPGEDDHVAAKHNPFAGLKNMMDKK